MPLICRKTYKRFLKSWLSPLLAATLGLACIVWVPDNPVYAATQAKTKTKTRTSGDVRKDKQRTEREIADTKKKINANQKKINSQLDELSNLDSQIERQENTIDELTETIERLNVRLDELSDSLIELHRSDSVMSLHVAKAMRERHLQRQRISSLPFVLGASSLRGAIQRLNYLNILQRATNNQVMALRRQRELIERRQSALDSVKASQAAAVKQLSTAKEILNQRRREAQRITDDLRQEGASLKQTLDEKNRRIRQLNAELDRIIAEEQRRAEEARRKKQQEEQRKKQQQSKQKGSKGSSAGKSSTTGSGKSTGISGTADADRKLTGSFAANKGKLLFPVAGKYTIVGTFGHSQRSMQPDNNGIDISVPAGTKARAVFDGTVSGIFFLDGYENVVMVRHGDYLTVYAGLSKITVAKGNKVTAGQNLGTIATMEGKTVLHFEVRKERSKLNPLQWVK